MGDGGGLGPGQSQLAGSVPLRTNRSDQRWIAPKKKKGKKRPSCWATGAFSQRGNAVNKLGATKTRRGPGRETC